MHPPSIGHPGHVPPGDSSQTSLEHPETSAYRCFLPDLTGFTGLRRPGPNSLHPPVRIEVLDTDLGREFHPAVADCGYRAPLAPRVARLQTYRRAATRTCQRVFTPPGSSDSRSRIEAAPGELVDKAVELAFVDLPDLPVKNSWVFITDQYGSRSKSQLLRYTCTGKRSGKTPKKPGRRLSSVSGIEKSGTASCFSDASSRAAAIRLSESGPSERLA